MLQLNKVNAGLDSRRHVVRTSKPPTSNSNFQCEWWVHGFGSPPFSVAVFFFPSFHLSSIPFLFFFIFFYSFSVSCCCFLSLFLALFLFSLFDSFSPLRASSYFIFRSSCIPSAYSKSWTNKQAAGGSRLLSIIQARQTTVRMLAKRMKYISASQKGK